MVRLLGGLSDLDALPRLSVSAYSLLVVWFRHSFGVSASDNECCANSILTLSGGHGLCGPVEPTGDSAAPSFLLHLKLPTAQDDVFIPSIERRGKSSKSTQWSGIDLKLPGLRCGP